MNCNCLNGDFRPYITSFTREFFIYDDLSDWMTEDYYYVPEKYTIQILLPGYAEFRDLEVYTNRSNLIEPSDLGLSSSYIPDGIYCLQIDNCGIIYKKNFAIAEKLECGVRNLLLRSIHTERNKDYAESNRLNLMIESLKIFATKNMPLEARRIYDYVEKELERLECSC